MLWWWTELRSVFLAKPNRNHNFCHISTVGFNFCTIFHQFIDLLNTKIASHQPDTVHQSCDDSRSVFAFSWWKSSRIWNIITSEPPEICVPFSKSHQPYQDKWKWAIVMKITKQNDRFPKKANWKRPTNFWKIKTVTVLDDHINGYSKHFTVDIFEFLDP